MATTIPTFDLRYLEFIILSWQKQGLKPIRPEELVEVISIEADTVFKELNEKGFLEENTSVSDINKALAFLKKLKFTKLSKTGPKGAKVDLLSVTPEGHTVFSAPEGIGGIRSQLTEYVVEQSPEIKELLRIFSNADPLLLPIVHPLPGVPTKGKKYSQLLERGLQDFIQQGVNETGESVEEIWMSEVTNKRISTTKLLGTIASFAFQKHPIRKVQGVDKIIPLAESMGLLWTGIHRLNPVVAVKSIGSSALEVNGSFVPNAPAWEQIKLRFFEELLVAHQQLADSSGFITIEELRGAFGKSLRISSLVFDALLCTARDVTDLEQGSLRLHFEEDEEAMYMKDRHPLIWKEGAYDLIAITPNAHHTNAYRKIETSVVN